MANLTVRGPARDLLRARTRVDQDALRRLHGSSALIVDDRRRRPLWFDGRFLAARDLTREQQYFLTRQSDLARAGGTGVVAGLNVDLESGGRVLHIGAGHGVTPSGEAVVLTDALTVRLDAIPEAQILDAAFGILRKPVTPVRNRTGLFLLALRPVELTANPIASYPTTITERRGAEDGDIVDAVAVTLIPYPDPGGDGELERRRARTAHALFVQSDRTGFPVDALPLAMVALERNTVRWMDVFLVRREVGSAHADVLGLGMAPRALREAHLLQYDAHLRDVLAERGGTNRTRSFAATDHFLSLPPCGPMPAQGIHPSDLRQIFFPPTMLVDLSIVAEDEVPALIEESFRLPPIDLTLDAEALESTSVMVVIPVPLGRVRTLEASLSRLTRTVPAPAPGLIADRRPIEVLRGIRLARVPAVVRPALDPAEALWRQELANAAASGDGLLWFVRRRNVDHRVELAGRAVALSGDENAVEATVNTRIGQLGLSPNVSRITANTTTIARADVISVLASPAVSASPLLANAVVAELEAKTTRPAPSGGTEPATIDRATVLRVSEKYTAPDTGEGLKRIDALMPELATDETSAKTIATSGRTLEIDRIAKLLSDDELNVFTTTLGGAAAAGDPAGVEAVVNSYAIVTSRKTTRTTR